MNKMPMLCLSLLMGAFWLQAQPAYPGSEASKTADEAQGPAVLEGCLQTSEGQYTITEKNGLLHHLSGGSKLLKSYVGHEVQLTGKPSIVTVDATLPGGASSAVEKPVFRVKTVKDVSATCPSSGR